MFANIPYSETDFAIQFSISFPVRAARGLAPGAAEGRLAPRVTEPESGMEPDGGVAGRRRTKLRLSYNKWKHMQGDRTRTQKTHTHTHAALEIII